ncbi:MAG: hypothetical protein ACYS0H_22940 [Planctomycetota bacterium]|jgi:signal transduction histidine kinase
MRSYQLSSPELRSRFDHFARSDALETVRDEVILLRAMISDRLDLTRNEADRIAAFSVIHPAIVNLSKLVETLCKLEKSTHMVLSKEALQKLGDIIVTILIEELSQVEGYTDIVDRVAGRIAAAISESRNTEPASSRSFRATI